MGAYINSSNRIDISDITNEDGLFDFVGYADLTDSRIESIAENDKIKYVQISHCLPDIAFENIDRILEKRPDITFRLYGCYGEEHFDLSILEKMPHLTRLNIDLHIAERQDMICPETICNIKNLKSLTLNIFDLRDYSFVKNLPLDFEELSIFSDTMGPGVKFDCEWLLRYKRLTDLYLGKKVKKNIKSIANLPSLKHLSLRGIKINSLEFLKNCNLESLSLLWCGMNDLNELREFTSLKYLELWRILKLEDISFISSLTNLEVFKLQDLNRIHYLPDLEGLDKLRKIILINVPIDREILPENIRQLVSEWE